jgi:hypothetical protein
VKCAVCRATGEYAGLTCPWCDGTGRHHWWDAWSPARASRAEDIVRRITRQVQVLRTTARPGEANQAVRELEAQARRLSSLFAEKASARPVPQPSAQPNARRPRGGRKGRRTGWQANRAWLTPAEFAVVEEAMRRKVA